LLFLVLFKITSSQVKMQHRSRRFA